MIIYRGQHVGRGVQVSFMPCIPYGGGSHQGPSPEGALGRLSCRSMLRHWSMADAECWVLQENAATELTELTAAFTAKAPESHVLSMQAGTHADR